MSLGTIAQRLHDWRWWRRSVTAVVVARGVGGCYGESRHIYTLFAVPCALRALSRVSRNPGNQQLDLVANLRHVGGEHLRHLVDLRCRVIMKCTPIYQFLETIYQPLRPREVSLDCQGARGEVGGWRRRSRRCWRWAEEGGTWWWAKSQGLRGLWVGKPLHAVYKPSSRTSFPSEKSLRTERSSSVLSTGITLGEEESGWGSCGTVGRRSCAMFSSSLGHVHNYIGASVSLHVRKFANDE